ncbi:hypothetical protein MSAN_01750800 [Mycena sanguinolenta]|uniref:Uncharacterized protein n=1 Tax=Mycena sanguinolenta TaxID=230812 RepID=A0A8H6XVL5_9AGAR|nr:hypothetical protein MSAN_01750800 [Mycena sanguinolenta]
MANDSDCSTDPALKSHSAKTSIRIVPTDAEIERIRAHLGRTRSPRSLDTGAHRPRRSGQGVHIITSIYSINPCQWAFSFNLSYDFTFRDSLFFCIYSNETWFSPPTAPHHGRNPMRSFLSIPLSLLPLASSLGFATVVGVAASELVVRDSAQCTSEQSCQPASYLVSRGSAECTSELSCEPASYPKRDINTWKNKARDLSNAERIQRRLPLRSPIRRDSASKVIYAARAVSSPVPPVTYSGVIQVLSGDTLLGYAAPDPNYWTLQLTSDITAALQVSFQLPQGSTSGSQLDFTQLNDARGPLLGLVVGRDSTNPDIAPGSYNYLYVDPVSGSTNAGSPPTEVPSLFSTSSGLDKRSETSIWSVDVLSGTLYPQWINSDGSFANTVMFVQSNHLYAGGDPPAFQSRFPSPVAAVTLKFIPI